MLKSLTFNFFKFGEGERMVFLHVKLQDKSNQKLHFGYQLCHDKVRALANLLVVKLEFGQ